MEVTAMLAYFRRITTKQLDGDEGASAVEYGLLLAAIAAARQGQDVVDGHGRHGDQLLGWSNPPTWEAARPTIVDPSIIPHPPRPTDCGSPTAEGQKAACSGG